MELKLRLVQSMYRTGILGCYSLFKMGLLLLFLACAFISACNVSPSWHTEAQSPDGKMIATARAFANGGFGISGVPSTFVYLNWTKGSQRPILIFNLSDNSDSSDGMNVGVNWLTSTHLELTYKSSSQNIDFQAVKCDGVNITVRDISKKVKVINTPQFLSPDRLWVAYARTEELDRSGTIGIYTRVFLKWVNGSQSAVDVLDFPSEQYSQPSTTNLTMKWEDASHLDVIYDGHAKIQKKIEQYGNIYITARDITGRTINSFQ